MYLLAEFFFQLVIVTKSRTYERRGHRVSAGVRASCVCVVRRQKKTEGDPRSVFERCVLLRAAHQYVSVRCASVCGVRVRACVCVCMSRARYSVCTCAARISVSARAQICERVRVCVCTCACVLLCAVRNAANAGAGALRAPFHNQYRRRRRRPIGKVRPVSTEPPPPKLLVDIPLYTTLYMYSGRGAAAAASNCARYQTPAPLLCVRAAAAVTDTATRDTHSFL